MKVEILSGDEVVGFGELNRLDPPMGVASGQFQPSAAYCRSVHASVINGNENDAGLSATLGVRGPYGMIECEAVGIEDYRDELGDLQVSVMGITEFDRLFSDRPDCTG